MFNFDQTLGPRWVQAGSTVKGDGKYVGAVMSEASQFRQYAEEALRWVGESTTEEEKRKLTELACMWAQAAWQSERVFGENASPPEMRAT